MKSKYTASLFQSPGKMVHQGKTHNLKPTTITRIFESNVLTKGPLALRDKAAVALMLFAGFRVGEMLSITVGGVSDFGEISDHAICPRQHLKYGKTKKKSQRPETRQVAMAPQLKEILRAYLESKGWLRKIVSGTERTRLLNTPLFSIKVRNMEDRIAKIKNEIEYHPTLAPHSFRHTFAQTCYDNAPEGSKAVEHTQICLGHKRITSTMHYLNIDATKATETTAALHFEIPM